MTQNIFLQEYNFIIYYLYQLKNILSILVAPLKFIHGYQIECQEKVLTTSNNSFSPTLINYFSVPDVKFNGHCLINKSIFTSGKVINL